MARLVMVGEVEDAARWEERFRSHRDLFSRIYPELGMNAIHFATTEEDRFVLYSEVDDLDAYFASLDSDEIKAAMANDGVKRDTVQVLVLDKQLTF